MDEIFWEVHSGLPQEAPGSDEMTAKAIAMANGLPADPLILDIGCGPGRQTIVLVQQTGGRVMALDNHQPFLDELARRVFARGLGDRVATINGSMLDMSFGMESFDMIWSEGAIYIMGFELGLRVFWPLLKPGGTVAVSELAWFTDQPSAEAKQFWSEGYPAMTSVAKNLDTIKSVGYELTGHFALPDSAWVDGYYGPLRERIDQLRGKYAGDATKLSRLDEEEAEITMFDKHSAEYGYDFYIMRKPPA
jgi:SAM-dependent methyltransferase